MMTRVYRFNNELACNIPTSMLPSEQREQVMTEYIKPGYRYTAPDWFYTTVYPYEDRLALILSHNPNVFSPAEMIANYGLDPTKRLQVRPYGTNTWIDAHLYHTTTLLDERGVYNPSMGVSKQVRGRAWIPKTPRSYWENKRNLIEKYNTYPVQIRGTTLPTVETKLRLKRIRDVNIKYLNQIYKGQEVRDDRYIWIIPDNLKCHTAMDISLSLGYQPMVDFYLFNNLIYANFMFPDHAVKLAKYIGRCFRCTSNIQLGLTDEKKYRFYFDIKSHYLSVCPQTYYVDPNGLPIEVSEALAWTNRNLLMNHPGFSNIRAGIKKGKLWVDGLISKFSTKNYMGTENQEIDFGEAEMEYGIVYRFYYAEKIVTYTDRMGVPLPAYGTERVEYTMTGARNIWVDKNGFVWRR